MSTVWPGKFIKSKKQPQKGLFKRQGIWVSWLWEELYAKLLAPGQLLGYPQKLWGMTAQTSYAEGWWPGQGVPKHVLSECCWSFSALAQSLVTGTPYVQKLIFWSFLTKTKLDQAFPSHVYGKILHHSNQFWLWFCSISTFFWDTLYSFATFIPQPQAHRI